MCRHWTFLDHFQPLKHDALYVWYLFLVCMRPNGLTVHGFRSLLSCLLITDWKLLKCLVRLLPLFPTLLCETGFSQTIRMRQNRILLSGTTISLLLIVNKKTETVFSLSYRNLCDFNAQFADHYIDILICQKGFMLNQVWETLHNARVQGDRLLWF